MGHQGGHDRSARTGSNRALGHSAYGHPGGLAVGIARCSTTMEDGHRTRKCRRGASVTAVPTVHCIALSALRSRHTRYLPTEACNRAARSPMRHCDSGTSPDHHASWLRSSSTTSTALGRVTSLTPWYMHTRGRNAHPEHLNRCPVVSCSVR